LLSQGFVPIVRHENPTPQHTKLGFFADYRCDSLCPTGWDENVIINLTHYITAGDFQEPEARLTLPNIFWMKMALDNPWIFD
jgi:hypothetical protein